MGISKKQYEEREMFLNILWLESYEGNTPKADDGSLLVPLKFSGKVKELGLLILRHAKTHGRLMLMKCNGPEHLELPYYWRKGESQGERHHEWSKWVDRREMLVERRLFQLAEELGITLELCGDPRGYTVKLVTSDTGRSNTLGESKSVWGIPGS